MVEATVPSRQSFLFVKFLRLASLVLVGASIVIVHRPDIDEVGESMESSNGHVMVSAGSHPLVIAWAVIAIALFIALMVRKPGAAVAGVPALYRRVLAFLIDFWFSLLALAAVGALLPLMLEAARTGHFAWHFQRNYSVSSDGLSAAFSLIFATLGMVFYFAFPLTRGRQTVGYFITRLKVTPPFGDEGRFTFRAALTRVFYSFIGLSVIWRRRWDRDEHGRTWYDRETSSTVVLVSD